ncbi:MAG: extracellular solute-binding protein [Fibrobacterota bacterium]
MKVTKISMLLVAVLIAVLSTGCGKRDGKKEITVLIRMLDSQKKYFQDKIIPAFEKKYNCKVNVADFKNASDLKRHLDLDKDKNEFSLVKTPFEVTKQLVDDGYMKPLRAVVEDTAYLNQDMQEYNDIARAMGVYNGEYYYIPRKLETRILFYRKSKVADAVAKYDSYADDISTRLEELNGYGLPAGYTFEDDPAQWDFYDLFTAGYIWSKEEYYGRNSGRIAHRAARYGGTALFFVDRAYQMGASTDDILALRGDAITETFLWEKIFIDEGLYNRGMWNNRWRGDDIYTGIQDGKVFLAYLQQIDCFNIHGWEEDPGMQSFLKDPSDMGVAVVPQAVSFTLDEDGTPAFRGSRQITTGGWWWGIPKSAPEGELAYEFARFITSYEVNLNESAQFGMIPVRDDILFKIKDVYEMGWVGDIYKTSIRQLQQQVDSSITIVPRVKEYPDLAYNYIDAWYSFIDGKHSDVTNTAAAVDSVLSSVFVPRAKDILGEGYPGEEDAE